MGKIERITSETGDLGGAGESGVRASIGGTLAENLHLEASLKKWRKKQEQQ